VTNPYALIGVGRTHIFWIIGDIAQFWDRDSRVGTNSLVYLRVAYSLCSI
jgi:hypothetical protein